jgi:integrase
VPRPQQCYKLKANGELIAPNARKISHEDLRKNFFLNYKTKGRKSLRSRKDGTPYLSNIRHLDNFFKQWKALNITADAVRRFVDKRQNAGASDASINRALAALKSMFRLAIQDGKIKNAPHIELCKEPNARGGVLDYGAFKKLLTELPGYLRGPVTLAFHTGMRLGEIAGLKRNQVDLKARTIRLNAGETKNDEGGLFR